MKKIALVTDSTADLTEEMTARFDAHIIPLKVSFGDEHFLSHELTPEEFYQRLEKSQQLPTTSQPSPEDFHSLYTKLLEKYDEIISVHVSSALSGTLNSANIAKNALHQAKINLVDSLSISLGIGLLVQEAALGIKEGLDAQAILTRLNQVRKNSEALFTLNTLEYLHKGGRIGKVSSMMGTLLNIKPVIRVGEEGVYVPAGKARSQDKALDSIVESFRQLANGRPALHLAVAHGAALEAGSRLRDALENAFSLKAGIFTQVGPVIGVHTGPGTIGAAIQFQG